MLIKDSGWLAMNAVRTHAGAPTGVAAWGRLWNPGISRGDLRGRILLPVVVREIRHANRHVDRFYEPDLLRVDLSSVATHWINRVGFLLLR